MLRIGVIGCGAIAQRRHLQEYATRQDVEIVAVCDPNLQRAEETAARFGASSAFERYEDLLAVEHIDAVSVCTPNFLHAPVSIDALKRGKHVLCEKPMAVTLEEAQEMVRVAEESNVYLMIGHNQRFMPVHQKAKEILDSGRLGRVLSFQTTFGHSGPENWSVDGNKSWFFDRKQALFGAVGDLGIHKVDVMRWLLNDEFADIQSVCETLHKPTNMEDHAVFLVKTKKGAVGTVTASWTYYGFEDNSTRIYGENGILLVGADPQYGVIVHYANGSKELHEVGRIATNEAGGQVRSGVIDHFVDGIIHGTGHSISGVEALKSMETVFAGMTKP